MAFGLLLLLPISVSAGLLTGLFNKSAEADYQKTARTNLENMALIALASPSSEIASNENIVDNDSLVALSGPAGSPAEISNQKPTSDQISVYVVREGDTLSQIAEMFGVTVNTVKWGNDLTSNTLQTGQTLVILPISGIKYTSVKGDTLASIAKKFKGDIEEIASYNNLEEGASLAVGTDLIIPDGEILSAPRTGDNSSSQARSTAGLKTYEGYYLRPIVGGRRSQGIHGYNAVDLAAPAGTPILASASGEVIIARSGGWNGGYGTYIVIKHENGTQTLYAHNQSNTVSAGDMVNQGDLIGYVGATGKVTGTHLHFEIRGAKNPF